MKYKLIADGGIVDLEKCSALPTKWENGAVVALDEHSPFVRELIEWVEAGNVPEAADAAPVATPVESPVKQVVDLLVAKNVITTEDADALTLDQGPKA